MLPEAVRPSWSLPDVETPNVAAEPKPAELNSTWYEPADPRSDAETSIPAAANAPLSPLITAATVSPADTAYVALFEPKDTV